jgi:hypothetical protein
MVFMVASRSYTLSLDMSSSSPISYTYIAFAPMKELRANVSCIASTLGSSLAFHLILLSTSYLLSVVPPIFILVFIFSISLVL